jgi:hypothetical protein
MYLSLEVFLFGNGKILLHPRSTLRHPGFLGAAAAGQIIATNGRLLGAVGQSPLQSYVHFPEITKLGQKNNKLFLSNTAGEI